MSDLVERLIVDLYANEGPLDTYSLTESLDRCGFVLVEADEIIRLREALEPFARYVELNDLLDSGDADRMIEVPVPDMKRAYMALRTQDEI